MTVQAVEVVPMTLRDLDEVIAIERLSFDMPWSVDSFRTELCLNRFAHYVLGRLAEEHRVVGYAGLWLVGDEGHITTLAVHPAHRRQGIGSFLLEYLLEKAAAKGVRKVFLEVRDTNWIARCLYEKFDFYNCGRKRKYYFDEDAVLMVKAF